MTNITLDSEVPCALKTGPESKLVQTKAIKDIIAFLKAKDCERISMYAPNMGIKILVWHDIASSAVNNDFILDAYQTGFRIIGSKKIYIK